MGTRNLTMVFINGKMLVSQYCQWDGYPSGQGITVLEFLRDKMDRATFLKHLAKCKPITKEQSDEFWKACSGSKTGWATMDVSERWKKNHPELHRDTGAKILEMIQDNPDGYLLQIDKTFAADSLFCEWGYVVDFDANRLEVYKGFNESPLDDGERFKHLESNVERGRDTTYFPIKLEHSWPLDALPTNEEFLATLERQEETEEA